MVPQPKNRVYLLLKKAENSKMSKDVRKENPKLQANIWVSKQK